MIYGWIPKLKPILKTSQIFPIDSVFPFQISKKVINKRIQIKNLLMQKSSEFSYVPQKVLNDLSQNLFFKWHESTPNLNKSFSKANISGEECWTLVWGISIWLRWGSSRDPWLDLTGGLMRRLKEIFLAADLYFRVREDRRQTRTFLSSWFSTSVWS